MVKKQVLKNLCNGCDLCCRKYKIYMFPSEAKAIARKLKINYKEFVEKYLDIYIELFSFEKDVQTDFLDITLNKKKYSAFVTLALKQEKQACVFLKDKQCSIYNARPLTCRLFPDFKFYGEHYYFCKLDLEKRKTKDPREFYPVLRSYLKDVKHNSFEKVWKYSPKIKKENIYLVIDGKSQTVDESLVKVIETIL